MTSIWASIESVTIFRYISAVFANKIVSNFDSQSHSINLSHAEMLRLISLTEQVVDLMDWNFQMNLSFEIDILSLSIFFWLIR